jgi:ankyrin repeat protein
MDVKTAIETGDDDALRRLLIEAPARANELIRWGTDCHISTHPLHYVSDMLFDGTLQKGKELPLVEALIQAGADLDFQRSGKGGNSDTPLIGAASLAAEDVGLRLIEAGARPELLGLFGETALHWAALLGEDRLARRLIQGADLNLKDEKYKSPPLGWAVHGRYNPPAGNQARQCEVAALLVSAGAKVESEWLESEQVRADSTMFAALRAGIPADPFTQCRP